MSDYVVDSWELASGLLHGGQGSFRVLIDKVACGAASFSLVLSVVDSDVVVEKHSHVVEHGLYVIDGTGVLEMNDNRLDVGPGTAAFIPPGVSHRLTRSGRAPLTYLVIYAPPGPEQELKRLQADAFRTET